MAIHVELEHLPGEDVRRLIDEGLDVFNAQKAGPDNAEDLWVIARDSSRNVQGGLKGRTFYSWLFIDWLWLTPAARGQGVGLQLLNRAEAAAQDTWVYRCLRRYIQFSSPRFLSQQRLQRIRSDEGCRLAMLAFGSKDI